MYLYIQVYDDLTSSLYGLLHLKKAYMLVGL